jgi:hypothetical protein
MKQGVLIAIGLVLNMILIAGVWRVNHLQINHLQDDIDGVADRVSASSDMLADRVNTLSEILTVTQQPVAARSDNPRLAEDVRVINEDVRVINEDVGAINDAVKILSEKLDTLTARLDNPVSGDETTQPEQEPIPPPSAEEQVALLETTLNDAEAYDEIWSNTTSVKIEELVRNAPAYQIAESVNTQCGGTLCKIEATLPASAKQHEKDLFEIKLVMDLATDLPRATVITKSEPDGAIKYAIYMERKSQSEPVSSRTSGVPD